ncbi:MAG: hypothetical protein ACTTIC_02625 [Helicobacteraceae bacterium]
MTGTLAIIFAALAIGLLYFKVIAPFSRRMLEKQKPDDELDGGLISFDEDEIEPVEDKTKELKRRLERQLDLGAASDEEKIRYDILLGRLKEMVQDRPQETGTLIDRLAGSAIGKGAGAKAQKGANPSAKPQKTEQKHKK